MFNEPKDETDFFRKFLGMRSVRCMALLTDGYHFDACIKNAQRSSWAANWLIRLDWFDQNVQILRLCGQFGPVSPLNPPEREI